MNELALFAGAGGGILGGHLLGWRTVCAVERNAYAAQVLAQRQNDGKGKRMDKRKCCKKCSEQAIARGLCRRHYDQWRRTDPAQVEKFNAANRRYSARKWSQKND